MTPHLAHSSTHDRRDPIDRAGLQVLLAVQRRDMDAGGEFELLNPSAAVVTMQHDVDHEPTT